MWQNGHGAIGQSVRESDRTEPKGGNTDRKSLRTISLDALADEELGGIGGVIMTNSVDALADEELASSSRNGHGTHSLTHTHPQKTSPKETERKLGLDFLLFSLLRTLLFRIALYWMVCLVENLVSENRTSDNTLEEAANLLTRFRVVVMDT